MSNSNQSKSNNNFSLGSVKEAIQEKNQLFAAAMAKGDAAGVAACYTIDAEFMAPGAPSVQGRTNIQAAIAGFIAQGFTEYTVVETIVYGNIDVVGVQEAYTLSQPGGVNKDVGKSIQLWKQEDNSWKIFRDCFNSDLTA
ncbi:MAG TPA: nuclear transport factor 2 family protein [Ferruginibacter sp.]|nr:nuclear transport factor 2 family protein [Niastella sp.]HRB31316.1 nuclear transport factor 2 family protein [Ferruginibacter sp.]